MQLIDEHVADVGQQRASLSKNASIITGMATFSSKIDADAAQCLRHRDRRVVADHSAGDLNHTFADDRVFLAGHDAAAGLDRGQDEFADAAPRAAAEQADVAGDFAESDGDIFQQRVDSDERICGRLRFGMVLGFF